MPFSTLRHVLGLPGVSSPPSSDVYFPEGGRWPLPPLTAKSRQTPLVSASPTIQIYSPWLYLLPSPGAGGPKKAAPWAAPGPRREERSPQPAQSGQPTEGRGRAGRGRGRPGGTHRGFGAEGPGGSPLWCGGWAMGPPGAARGRPEDRVPEPSEPPIGRSEASGGPGRRRSDGRAQAAIARGQRSRGPEGHGGEATAWRAGRSPGAAAVRSQRPPSVGAGGGGRKPMRRGPTGANIPLMFRPEVRQDRGRNKGANDGARRHGRAYARP